MGGQQGHELAPLDRITGEKIGDSNEARAGHRKPQCRLGIVHCDPAGRFNFLNAASRLERPAIERGHRAKSNTVMLRKVFRRLGGPATREIIRRAEYIALGSREDARDQRRIANRADTDRYVAILGDQIDGAVGNGKVKLDVGVATKERRQRTSASAFSIAARMSRARRWYVSPSGVRASRRVVRWRRRVPRRGPQGARSAWTPHVTGGEIRTVTAGRRP